MSVLVDSALFCSGEAMRKALRESGCHEKGFKEWTKSVWVMNPASAKQVGLLAPFPVERLYR